MTADFPFDIEDVTRLVGLNIRRVCGDGVYTDCPFCEDRRGKLKVNYVKNVWRCNHCGESGGMLSLYAKVKGISTQIAYREICDALQNGIVLSREMLSVDSKPHEEIRENTRVSPDVLHATYSALLGELRLVSAHREHLRTVRGLSDEEIDKMGFRSTPPFYLCQSITERLINLGHTVAGVPGFYERDGKWTMNFCSFTAGILLPAQDMEGRIIGFQIRLDSPIKDENDPPDKPGGCSSGSPVHLIGDRTARTVYVTEGVLKADIAHCLTGRTFAAVAGANNLSSLEGIFRQLSAGGTKLKYGKEQHDLSKLRTKDEVSIQWITALLRLRTNMQRQCELQSLLPLAVFALLLNHL